MTNLRPYISYLADIIAAMEKIEVFIQGFDEMSFHQDEKTIFAVIRALEIIGEASKRIPDTARQRHPSVPWRAMTGMRDKLIHDYTIVDVTVVWKTATEDVPVLKPLLKQMISELQSQSNAVN